MNQKFKSWLFLVLGISLTLAACNQSDKKDEKPNTADSAATVKMDTTAAPAKDNTPDALKAAPDHYKVISDTLGMRLLEVTYKPGDSSVLHSHPDYAIYVAEGGTATFYGKDGSKMVNEMRSGMSMIRPAEVHSVKNTGKTTIKVILVEVKRPKDTVPGDAAMDPTKVAPDLYKSKEDTMGIRVLEATYKPGQSSAMHTHPDNAIYMISGGKAEFTAKDGTKSPAELKTGAGMIMSGGSHSVKNTGTTTMKVLIVEVNRHR